MSNWTVAEALRAALLALWLASPLAAQTLERGNGPEPDTLDPQRAQGLSAQQVLRDLEDPDIGGAAA